VRRALDRREEAEHAFLAFCLAVPDAGARRLADPETSSLLSSALARRAAAHLREHLDAPATGLPADDDELSRLIAELVIRAGGMDEPETSELDRAALMLSLARLDRDIAAARLDQTPVSELAAERQRVLGELRRLTR
jgi:DNA primase